MTGIRGPVSVAPAFGFVVLATLLVVPDVVAQEPYGPELEFDAAVTPHYGPVTPIYETGTAEILLRVTCEPPGVTIQPQAVTLRVEPEQPETMTAILSPSMVFVSYGEEECIATPASNDYELEVDFTYSSKAPAFLETGFRLFASHDGEEHLVAEWTQEPGLYGRWQARFDQSVIKAPSDENIQIPGTIENHGNGPIVVKLKEENPPTQGSFVLPRPLVVPYTEPENVQDFHLDYKAEGTGRDEAEIRFAGAWTQDSTVELEPITRRVMIQVEYDLVGEAAVLPGLIVGAVLLGVLGAVRRRQGTE